MQIDLTMNVYPPKKIDYIIAKLNKAMEKGFITSRSENNNHLLASYKGVENKGISPKWNVKIYSYNTRKKGHSITCIDDFVLYKLIEEDYESFEPPPELILLRIDDAGWGFPLCGIMVGVSDEQEVKTAVVPVEYFRSGLKNGFHTKGYLKKYSSLGLELVREFGATPETHRIEICTGYVNQPLKEKLRHLGYNVRVVEIKGMLQDELEKCFKEYVHETVGADLYYDPKDMDRAKIPKKYWDCLKYGKKHCPHLIKTGWDSIK
ncbi:MAG: hypothetical protein JXJ04_09520 [Spirochaetales bacterium]|nr:hypothetical protein [Spirochaetales bacterium]